MAQKQLVDIKRATSVDVVTKEQIEQFSFRNMEEILKFDPVNHHLNSRTITYDYNDPGIDKRVDKIFYDAQNNPSYLQSTTVNLNGIPVEAIEETWVNNRFVQGHSWGNINGKQWEDLYDSSGTGSTLSFQGTWQPKYEYIPVSPLQIKIDVSGWNKEVSDALAQPDGTITEPDHSYSPNGKAEIKRWKDGDVRVKEERVYDARGVLREYSYYEYYPDDFVYEETSYYNCRGEKIYFESTWYDDEDYEIEMIDIVYQDGKPAAGWRDTEDYDYVGQSRLRQYYNPATQQFEFLLWNAWKYNNYAFNLQDQDDPCDYPDDYFVVGPRLILEDSDPERFSTYGVFANYTALLNPHWGLSADAGFTVGKESDIKYTKINVMVGPTWFPCSRMDLDDPFSFSAHLFAGLSHVTSKYDFGGNAYSASGSSFAAMTGLDGYYNFSQKMGLRASANLNMNFASGNTTTNYLFDLGLRFSF